MARTVPFAEHVLKAALVAAVALGAGCTPSVADNGGALGPEDLIQKCMGISNWSSWSNSASSGGWKITRREDAFGEYVYGTRNKQILMASRSPDVYQTYHTRDRLQRCEIHYVFKDSHEADKFIANIKTDLHLKPSPSGDTYTSVFPSGEKIRMVYDKNKPSDPTDPTMFLSAVIHNDPQYIKS